MITIATLLWQANRHSFSFSRCYDESWVEKLYRGFERNLTQPFRFVVFTDRPREFSEPVEQELLSSRRPSYGHCIEPYRLGEPMILVGLDTIVTGRVDHLAAYCLDADVIALHRDPYKPDQAGNGVALVPAGNEHVWTYWRGQNDMEWMRRQEHVFTDDLFPGHVQSFKGAVKANGLGDTRLVYFHGREKPHELLGRVPWIEEHWR